MPVPACAAVFAVYCQGIHIVKEVKLTVRDQFPDYERITVVAKQILKHRRYLQDVFRCADQKQFEFAVIKTGTIDLQNSADRTGIGNCAEN